MVHNWTQHKTKIKTLFYLQNPVVKSTDTAKASSNFEKKSKYNYQVNFRESHQISWNSGGLLKSYDTKYTRGLGLTKSSSSAGCTRRRLGNTSTVIKCAFRHSAKSSSAVRPAGKKTSGVLFSGGREID